jgi:hypothetical protein
MRAQQQAHLRLCQLYKHLGCWVGDRHLVENGGTIVCDDHLAVCCCYLRHQQAEAFGSTDWKANGRDVLSVIADGSYSGFGCIMLCVLMILTILSMPLGPRLVRTASATAFAASMFASRTSFFFVVSLESYEVQKAFRS